MKRTPTRAPPEAVNEALPSLLPFRPGLLRTARRGGFDDAEAHAAVDDTLLAAAQAVAEGKVLDHPRAYMVRILRRKLGYARKKCDHAPEHLFMPEVEHEIETSRDAPPWQEQVLLHTELGIRLAFMLRPEELQLLTAMVDKASSDEIAASESITTSAAKVRVHRLRKKLRDLFEDDRIYAGASFAQLGEMLAVRMIVAFTVFTLILILHMIGVIRRSTRR